MDADARIVHNPHFEAEVLKIQERNEAFMNVLETKEVSGLLLTTDGSRENREAVASVIERAAKQLRTNDSTKPYGFMDIRFLLPTLNMLERFLSLVEHAMTNRRKVTLPVNRNFSCT